MKEIRKDQTQRFKNSPVCTAIEYPLGDEDINGAVIELAGRYPDEGRVVNEKCKGLSFIISGSGKVVVEGKEVELQEGDMVLIEPGERYYWDGEMTMLMSCTPAWSPEQYKEVE